jgi:hypothetical protein
MQRISKIIFLTSLLAALSACEKSPTNTTKTVAAKDTSSDEVPRRSGNRSYSFLDMSWKTLPEIQYAEFYNKFRNLYWSGTPKDLDKLAADFSVDYRREKDGFKRSDLLKQLEPSLEKYYSEAQQHKDYSIRPLQSSAYVSSYDQKLGQYRITFSSDSEQYRLKKDADIHINDTEWHLLYLGIPDNNFGTEILYKPKDESEARKIESALSRQRKSGNDVAAAAVQFDGSVIGNMHDAFSDTALFGVDNIIVLDKDTGSPLFTIKSEDLGPMHVRETQIRKALGLPELRSKAQMY